MTSQRDSKALLPPTKGDEDSQISRSIELFLVPFVGPEYARRYANVILDSRFPAVIPAIIFGGFLLWAFSGEPVSSPVTTLGLHLPNRCIAFIRPDPVEAQPASTASVLSEVADKIGTTITESARVKSVLHRGDFASLEERIRDLYRRDYCRVFVVTNGSSVRAVVDGFRRFRQELQNAGTVEIPVLVATVISQQGVASSADGIYRYFIPVHQEAAAIANAVSSSAPQFGVFYIDAADTGDSYGEDAANEIQRIIRNRRTSTTVVARAIDRDGERAASAVRDYFRNAGSYDTASVAVVGFGSMFERTFAALSAQGARAWFASVLATDPALMKRVPDGTRVFVPYPAYEPYRDDASGASVIRAFPLRAIRKAVECTSKPFIADHFDRCWKQTTQADRSMGVEMLASGDVSVSLVIREIGG